MEDEDTDRDRNRGIETEGEGQEETRRTKQLTQASDLLQTIIDEVGREHFIEEAARMVEDEDEDEEEEEAKDVAHEAGSGASQGSGAWGGKGRSGESLSRIARKVVKVYMDKLDNVFLASLLAYIQAAKDQNKQDVVELLHCIYEQIILLLREDLPSGVQMVDILTQVVGKKDRTNVMRKGLRQYDQDDQETTKTKTKEKDQTRASSLDVPPCDPSEVFSACQDMLGQMEKQEAFDTLLYYRLCCVREEARDFSCTETETETEARPATVRGAAGFRKKKDKDTAVGVGPVGLANVYSHALPPSELALVKELLYITDPLRIAALLKKSFAEFDGLLQTHFDPTDALGPPQPLSLSLSSPPLGSSPFSSSVSPHRFLECLAALVYESELKDNQRFDQGGKEEGNQSDVKGAGRPSPKVVQQLRTIRETSMCVLYDLAQLKEE